MSDAYLDWLDERAKEIARQKDQAEELYFAELDRIENKRLLLLDARDLYEAFLGSPDGPGEVLATPALDPSGDTQLASVTQGNAVGHSQVGGATLAAAMAATPGAGVDGLGIPDMGVGGSHLAPASRAAAHRSSEGSGRERIEVGHADPSSTIEAGETVEEGAERNREPVPILDAGPIPPFLRKVAR